MSEVDVKEIKRDRSRSPVGGDDDSPRDRNRRMDRNKPVSKVRGRKAPSSHRVYVSNIPYEYKWQDLKDLFRNEIGEVNYVEMFKDESGRNRGCSVIEFETAELAQKAIDQMHRYELAGRKLVVKEVTDYDIDRDSQGRIRKDISRSGGGGGGGGGSSMMPSQSRMGSGGPVNYGNTYGLSVVFLESLGINVPLVNKVFVANLDYSVDVNQLREVFKVAGKVVNVEISKDQETNKSRGFGVVEYEHPVEAVQAISMLNGQMYYDRKMSVRMDRVQDKKSDPVSGSKLPQGLKGLGMGLGINGSALTDVSTFQPAFVHDAALSTNTASTSVATNMAANMPMGNMGAPNAMGMANTAMGVMNPMASGMGANMGQGMNAMGSGMGTAMGGMGSGLMGMGAQNAGMDTMGAGNNMMGASNNMMANNMMSSSGGLGSQVTGMNRMGSGFGGGFSSSGADMNGSQRNFGSYGGGGVGGGVGASGAGSVVQISNLPMETTWQNLRDLCREYGEIRFAEIRTKGTGAVKFHTEADARRAADMLDRQRFSGRMLEARVI
ncbi:RNA recognition motif domain [Trinorchestia longiramus]|nr:RNA recognition motif domain [Trinorchestia longiramus]